MRVSRCECFERTIRKSACHFSFEKAADLFFVCWLPWRYRYKRCRCDPITSWVHVLIVWHQTQSKKREAKTSPLSLAAIFPRKKYKKCMRFLSTLRIKRINFCLPFECYLIIPFTYQFCFHCVFLLYLVAMTRERWQIVNDMGNGNVVKLTWHSLRADRWLVKSGTMDSLRHSEYWNKLNYVSFYLTPKMECKRI